MGLRKLRKTLSLPEEIQIAAGGKSRRVGTAGYISAKTKQLREFGYEKLTEEDVRRQLGLILAGKKTMHDGLTIIGIFMVEEVIS